MPDLSKSGSSKTGNPAWRPVANKTALQARAVLYAKVRSFFAERDVLAVETPVLAAATVTEPHIDSISSDNVQPSGAASSTRYFLQTSPEYAMKRLLAAGMGAIYQISKVFRAGEQSQRHNPEFSMLEWYRPGWDDHQLMDEVVALLQPLLELKGVERRSYRDVFRNVLGVDPHTTSDEVLLALVNEHIQLAGMSTLTRNDCLDLLMTHCVEPRLPADVLCLIYDYPASQAALAKKHTDATGTVIARRFEVYARGLELANGYYELTDAAEQRLRFEQDNALRQSMDKPVLPVDEALIAALADGMPDCAGVAIGLDRVLMLQLGVSDIADVLAFPIDRA